MLSMRRSCVLIVSLSLVLFFCLGTISKAQEGEDAKSKPSSTLAVGTWGVDASSKLTFTYKIGHKAGKKVFTFDSFQIWSLELPNSFMADVEGFTLDGTWKENGNKVTVSLPSSEFAEFDAFLDAGVKDVSGYVVDINITKITGSGKVGTSTFSGKQTINGSFFIPAFGVSGKIAVTTNFSGAKTALLPTVDADPESGSLKAAIVEMVKEAISSPEE